jgi:hypothetical protein
MLRMYVTDRNGLWIIADGLYLVDIDIVTL